MRRWRRLDLKAIAGVRFFGSSLSARVLWLTVGIILLVELFVLMPSLGRERQSWMWERLTQAHLAAYAVENDAGAADDGTRATLLRLAGVLAVNLEAPGRSVAIGPAAGVAPGLIVDLAHETLLQSTWRAQLLLVGLFDPHETVVAPSPQAPRVHLRVVVDAAALSRYLRDYAGHVAALSVIVALITGLLLFTALDRLLVRPMQIMTASIVGFRKDPEHAAQSDIGWLANRPNDEISLAARELKVMQEEMRAALWRNARLAALGTAVAKISHDLRNILSSALLVADRLQDSVDPEAQRAAKTLIPAVERAAQLVSRTVDFAREGPPAITRTAVRVRELVEEASAVLRPDEVGIDIENHVPDDLVLALDRAQIYRVLVNLLRNAVEAGADALRISIQSKRGITRLVVSDNGPGLPLRVQDNLFKPFTGSGRYGGTGLGLAIARDLIRAHGGELLLDKTGPRGTVFIMDLATTDVQ
jgi:signal transduction histidine kinase